MKTAKPINRRNFLLAAGLGSAGAAAIVAGTRKAPAKTSLAEEAAQPSGYHVSEHILKYYKTTKV